MENETAAAGAPPSYWAVTTLGLLWNLFGG